MSVYRQNSFIGGMLSPSLEGRTDYEKRLAGARIIENFFVTPYGTLRRRPGMRYVADIYTHLSRFGPEDVSASDRAARLLTFRGADNVDVLIVLSHLAGVAMRNGDAEDIKSFVTPWKGRDLAPDPHDGTRPGVKWSQSGNNILVTHPAYRPRYIRAPSDESAEWLVVDGSVPLDALNAGSFFGNYIADED